MKMTEAFTLVCAVALLLPTLALAQDPLERVAIFPLEEIERGQKGYGYSVFSGSEPDRFEVEVIGLLRNTDPGTSYILTRISGQDLERSGVASGMSGSPIYIDDRLVGALAFSWPYAKEAIAGITPIAAMRSIGELPSGLSLPPPPTPATQAGAPVVTVADVEITPEMLLAGNVPADLAEKALGLLAPRMGSAPSGARSSVQWSISGFDDTARMRLDGALGATGAMGATVPTGGEPVGDLPDLVRGGPVAAVLVDGDLRLAASGTVTELHDGEVLAFGHSFLGMGPVSVPMAKSEVVMVMPSAYSSFKISNMGEIIGAFEQDQLSGIRGTVGAEAPMVPLTLEIGGLRERRYEMRLAAVPQLMPALVAASLIGSLETTSYANGPQGIDVTATFRLKNWDDLTVRQSFDGSSAGAEASSYLVGMSSYLSNNNLERVTIEGIDVQLEQTARPHGATLVSAHAERTLVRPGETVRLHLALRGFEGRTFRRTVEVPIAEDLPAGRLTLLVGDGASADAARLQLVPTSPVSFPQALEQLRSYHSRQELVVLQAFRDDGLATGGSALPRLPGSIRAIWDASASGGAQKLRLAVVESVVETLSFPLDGLVRIDLEVKRRRPLTAGPAGPVGPTGQGPPATDDDSPNQTDQMDQENDT